MLKPLQANDAQLAEWLAHPVTQLFMRSVGDALHTEESRLGKGLTLDRENEHCTQANTAEAVGLCKAYNQVMGIKVAVIVKPREK